VRELTDRRAECGVLDGLVEAVRAGESRVLVVHGEAGVGKTALLEYLADRASRCRVLRVAGVQSEMELAFAGLHQLCAPLLDRLRVLPGPQQGALRTAFGMSAGPVPDRFLVGLATLGLLAEAAEERPVVCLADDAQWLDRASVQALAFVARRLGAESVGLVFSAWVADGELATLPELEVKGLPERDARALLDAALTGPVDARVREQIVAETRGNPLALLELPRVWTPTHLAGGFGLPGALPGRIEDSFRRRVDALPAQARRLLLLAAADPTGDPVLVWRAAAQLGISTLAAGSAAEAGLAQFDARVQFRHPLVRSAAYQSASARDRQEVHRALADATDPEADPDRRAWHRAQAAAGPDEEVAAELEGSAGRAQARGGLAAAAAFGERAGMAVFMLVAAAGVGFLTGVPKTVLVMVGFSFFITSFAIGVGGTGWLIQGEVFPTAVRGRAAAIGASVDWIANFALIEVFPAWKNAIGLGWVMVSFAVIAVLAIGFVARWLPETKGLSVEEAVAVFERQAEGSKAPA
jgi:Sugar (and other) transporter/AAA ATPase domain